MKINRYLIYKSIKVSLFAVAGAAAAAFYALLIEEYSIIWYVTLFGLALGALVGVVEEFVLLLWLKKYNFLKLVVYRMMINLSLVLIIFVAMYIADSFIQGYPVVVSLQGMWTTKFGIQLLYTFTVIDILIIINSVSRIIGPGRLIALYFGKYLHPSYENRIFMFIDLNDSTKIAELLGPEDYFKFLDEFFHHLTNPILNTGGQVYQYVGDEIVITWPLKKGVKHAHCIDMYFRAREQLKKKEQKFLKRYGFFPYFKAGMHCGEVIAAEIGDFRRELVFSGDVVNTAARIRTECTTLKCNFLISGDLLKILDLPGKYESIPMNSVKFKGKSEPVELYSVALKEEMKRQAG